MGKIKHNLLPNQRSRQYNLKADIDLYPYAQELYDELDKIGVIDRLMHIPQLGVIKTSKKLSKTRYDYIMLQLYLHQLVKNNLQSQLRLTYNNSVKAKEFRTDYMYDIKDKTPTIGDILQILTIIYNIGHFYNTFTSSRAIIMISVKNKTFMDMLLNALEDQRYKDAVSMVIEKRDYQRFHLLNSILILKKCDKNKRSISIAIEILYAYINQAKLKKDSKLAYIFDIFKTVRNVSYMAYDLQIANTPITIDLCNTTAMLLLLRELLSEYNNTQLSHDLLTSIGKLLDDTVYNENSNAICYYKISQRMVKLLSQENTFSEKDYYSEYFFNHDSILNLNYSHKRDFIQEQILKLTFNNEEKSFSESLLSNLESINNTRVGYYDRHKGERTILVSIKKNCCQTSKIIAAFKILKCTISYLKRVDGISAYDTRFLLCTKFFLFYFFDENPIVIKPTIDKEKCVICTRGRSARVKAINTLLKNTVGNEDQRHETQFIIDYLKEDNINDTSICIPASIVVYRKDLTGEKLCELDGLVIHPMRKQYQILFFEAKNTSTNPSYGKKCLKEKLEKLNIKYDSNSIKIFGYDALLMHTL